MSGYAKFLDRTEGSPVVRVTTTGGASQVVVGRKSAIVADIEEFRGIPYGTVSQRWQHSRLRESLPSDIFDATSNGPRCPQPHEPNNTIYAFQSHLDFPSDVLESEFDCLNLFISRPSKSAIIDAGLSDWLGRLPVYLYIHGGAYGFGAGSDPMWNPARLISRSIALRKPFVAVYINYRLNIFGFAASSELIVAQKSPAKGCNFALGDQRTALEWVSRNIAAFGGDPNQITVAGQSAGASSAHALVLDAKFSSDPPLLKRAIIESGAIGSLGPNPLADTEKDWDFMCKHFGLQDLSAGDRLERLLAVPAEDLLALARSANWWTFRLVEDGLTLSRREDGQFIMSLKLNNKSVLEAAGIQAGQVIDILIGDTDVEGIVYRDNPVSRIESFAQVEAAANASSASANAVSEIMHHYGLNDGVSVATLHEQLLQLLGDSTFGLPVEQASKNLSTSRPPHLVLSNERSTKTTRYRVQFGNPFPGPSCNIAGHCVDIIYIYDCFYQHLRAVDDEEDTQDDRGTASNTSLVEQIQSDWINFINNGEIQGGETADESVSEDIIVIYGQDRRRRVVCQANDRDYQHRKTRFEVLERHPDDARRFLTALKTM